MRNEREQDRWLLRDYNRLYDTKVLARRTCNGLAFLRERTGLKNELGQDRLGQWKIAMDFVVRETRCNALRPKLPSRVNERD